MKPGVGLRHWHRWLVLAAAVHPCCEAPPDRVQPFAWSVALTGLDDAVLSVCAGAQRLLAVGGQPGQGRVFEWFDNSWRTVDLPADADLLWWCWIDEDGQALAVGDSATVVRSTGSVAAFVREDTGDAIADNVQLFGVWGASAEDVFVVGGATRPDGDAPVIARFNGSSWFADDTAAAPAELLLKVWGSAGNDVWAVGNGGTILHHDALSWTRVQSGTDQRLVAVWGVDSQQAFAVGGNGAGLILRYDGAAWSHYATTPERLSGVWTAADRDVFVGGDRGFVARLDRTNPDKQLRAVVDATVDIHAVTGDRGDVLACGADLISQGTPSWAGAVFVHGRARGTGSVTGSIADAGAADAPAVPSADASPYPGAGQLCGTAPNLCAPDLECWGLLRSDVFICTRPCDNVSQCFEYGAGACCAVPGLQTLTKVCIPSGYQECP
jgi:hypothetical protein